MFRRSVVPVGVGLLAVMAFAALAYRSPRHAIFLSGAVFVGLVTFREFPRFALFLIIALIPFDGFIQWNSVIFNTLNTTIFAPAFGLLIYQRLAERRPLAWSDQFLYVLGLAAAVVLSACFALLRWHDQLLYLGVWRWVRILMLYVFAVNVLQTPRDIRWALGLIIGSCALSVLASALVDRPEINVPGLHMQVEAPLVGFSIADPNTYGMYLMAALFLALYFGFTAIRIRHRVLLFGLAGVLLIGIVLTYSRGVALSTALTFAYAMVWLRKRIPLLRVGVILTALVLCIAPLLPLESYSARISTLITERAYDPSIQFRKSIIQVAMSVGLEHPLLGVGPMNFGPTYLNDSAYRDYIDTNVDWYETHNLYLALLTELGLVGLILFGLLILHVLRTLRRIETRLHAEQRAGGAWPFPDARFLANSAGAVHLAIVAVLIEAMFISLQYNKLLWTLVAVAATLTAIDRDRMTGAATAASPDRPRPAGSPARTSDNVG